MSTELTTLETTATPFEVAVSSKALLDALTRVKPAISKRSILPILQNVKMRTSTLGLQLAATNLEIYVKANVPLSETDLKQKGEITVPFKDLEYVARLFKGQQLTLRLSEKTLYVETTNSVYPLPTLPVEDYPNPPFSASEEPASVTLPAQAFARMIRNVVFAAADDDSRPVLTSIMLELENDVLTVVAADAFRLASESETVAGAGTWNQSLLLPAKAIESVVKHLPKEGMITIERGNNDIARLSSGPLTVFSRLIEGQFPPFRAIIPRSDEVKMTLTIASADLERALRQVEPAARNSANITRLHPQANAIEVVAQEEDREPVRVSIPAHRENEAIEEIIYNNLYLREICTAQPKTLLTLSVSSPVKPLRVTSAASPNWTAVLMPMYIQK